MEYDETSKKNSVDKENILEKLCESVLSEQTESEGIEGLGKKLAENVDAAELIKKMDEMIGTRRNDVLMIAYQQGKIFKRFKTDNKFINAVTKFEITKATINFKIAIVKFIDDYLKNNFRVIKEVCQEHASEF